MVYLYVKLLVLPGANHYQYTRFSVTHITLNFSTEPDFMIRMHGAVSNLSNVRLCTTQPRNWHISIGLQCEGELPGNSSCQSLSPQKETWLQRVLYSGELAMNCGALGRTSGPSHHYGKMEDCHSSLPWISEELGFKSSRLQRCPPILRTHAVVDALHTGAMPSYPS